MRCAVPIGRTTATAICAGRLLAGGGADVKGTGGMLGGENDGDFCDDANGFSAGMLGGATEAGVDAIAMNSDASAANSEGTGAACGMTGAIEAGARGACACAVIGRTALIGGGVEMRRATGGGGGAEDFFGVTSAASTMSSSSSSKSIVGARSRMTGGSVLYAAGTASTLADDGGEDFVAVTVGA